MICFCFFEILTTTDIALEQCFRKVCQWHLKSVLMASQQPFNSLSTTSQQPLNILATSSQQSFCAGLREPC